MNTQTRVHYNGPQGAVSVVWLIMSFVSHRDALVWDWGRTGVIWGL